MTGTATALDEPIKGLLATPPGPLPYVAGAQVRSFVLRRPQGTVVVYNSPGLTVAAEAVRALGPLTHLLVNHAHEAMYGPPGLDVPAFVGEADRAEAARGMPVTGSFSERCTLDGDLEVVPAPGHTPGTTSYLWHGGAHRFLFTGDSLWVRHGRWEAVVLPSSDRTASLDSLAVLREIDFDVLVPWASMQGESPVVVVDRAEARSRIDEVIRRVRAGSSS